MTTATSESEQRIAIWSLPARVIGVYFAIYLIQYIPSVAFEAYTYQRAADEAFARAAIEIIKASGPIGIGSATNALAVAMLVEAVMVLASIINKQQREEGIKIGIEQGIKQGVQQGIEQGVQQGIEQGVQQGIEQGVQQERKRSNAKLRALAKEYGIPEHELPIEPEDDE